MNAYDAITIYSLAMALNDSVSKFSNENVKGFILDLRLNGGGNIYPMLAGLNSLLGNTTIAYETDADDKQVRKWTMKDGNFYLGDYKATDIPVKPIKKFNKIPVVVLIGPNTKSSGSITAIAFKNRPNTYFIGEPTANG